MHQTERSILAASNPQRWLAIAVLTTFILGLAIAIGGFLYPVDWFEPLTVREPGYDWLNGLDVNRFAAIASGLLLAMSVPFFIWRRSAPRWQFVVAGSALVVLAFAFAPVIEFATIAVLVLAYLLFFREALRIGRVENAGLRRRAVFAFAWPFSGSHALTYRARQRDTPANVEAYHLPEHTRPAKAAINRVLKERGEPEQIEDPDWLPPPERATLPAPYRHSVGAKLYGKLIRRRRVLQAVNVMIALFIVIVALLASFTTVGGFSAWMIVAYATILLTLLTIIGAMFCQLRAGRVLLLRPFGEARMTAALKGVVTKHLGPAAYVYTLSDRNYKPNLLLALLERIIDSVAVVLGPLLRPSYRITSVKDERTFFILAAFVTKKLKPSVLSLQSGNQGFNIRSTDSWWKRCIDLLMRSCDVIVMDLSRVSKGSAWEIAQLADRGLLAKSILIAQKGYEAEGLAYLRRMSTDGVKAPIFVFDENADFENSEEFETTFRQRLYDAASQWGAARAAPDTNFPEHYNGLWYRRERDGTVLVFNDAGSPQRYATWKEFWDAATAAGETRT
jgi:hypothetical protein